MRRHLKFERVDSLILQQTAIIPKKLVLLVCMRDCKAAHSFGLILVDLEMAGDGTVMLFECEGDLGELEAEPPALLVTVGDFVRDLFAYGIRVLPADV
jgi:hypothetical protein